MNHKIKIMLGAALCGLWMLVNSVLAMPSPNPFTYQGQLLKGGAAVNGNYDLTFTVFDSASGNNVVGGTLTNLATPVSNGLFTVTLDFGGGVFTGPQRWLQIAVTTNGGASFTNLAPRQLLTAAPYALYAPSAGTAATALSVPGGNISGPIGFVNLPAGVITNGQTGLTLGGIFIGNGATGPASTVGGGEGTSATGLWSTVGGGVGNGASNMSTTVAGGYYNGSGGNAATVGGGAGNIASGDFSTIAGGNVSMTAGGFATVGGGDLNSASGYIATVPGGFSNSASGNYSFAAGNQAQALHQGAFVWGDSQNTTFSSTGNDQFLIRAQGGVGIGTNSPGAALDVAGNIHASGTISGVFVGAGATGTGAVVGGGIGNGSGGNDSAVGGGATNAAAGNYSTIAGGNLNTAAADYSTVGGGGGNSIGAAGLYATVAGGNNNSAATSYATASGGNGNHASGQFSTVSGGAGNTASGTLAVIPGGSGNTASGGYAFAAGNQAHAVNQGAFVWADSQNATYSSTGNDQFLIRAQGGVGIGTNSPHYPLQVAGSCAATSFVTTSDRNAKENFVPVSPLETLAKVASLPVTRWNFKEDKTQNHIGPMAQDFHAAFNVGADDKHIATVDEEGVALAAIQGLNEKVEVGTQKSEAQISELKAENAELKSRLEKLEQLLSDVARTGHTSEEHDH